MHQQVGGVAVQPCRDVYADGVRCRFEVICGKLLAGMGADEVLDRFPAIIGQHEFLTSRRCNSQSGDS